MAIVMAMGTEALKPFLENDMFSWFGGNRNARIRSRVTKNKKFRTETAGRDDGLRMSITTSPKTNATQLFIDFDGGEIRGGETVRLSGSEARSIFRMLAKHYGFVGKSLAPIKGKVSV